MKSLLYLLAIVFIGFVSCNKDEYGKVLSELLNDIEYTKEELLVGFSQPQKYWKIVTIEYNGSIIQPDTSKYCYLNLYKEECRACLVEETVIKNSIELDSIKFCSGVGSISFMDKDIDIQFDFSEKILVEAFYFEELGEYYCKYEEARKCPFITGKWNYDEQNNELTIKNVSITMDVMNEPFENYNDLKFNILELSESSMKLEWNDPFLGKKYIIHFKN